MPVLGLLTQVRNQVDANPVSQYDYGHDAAGRRTSVKMTGEGFEAMGATFNLYGYNTRSELTGAARYFGANLQGKRPVNPSSAELMGCARLQDMREDMPGMSGRGTWRDAHEQAGTAAAEC